MTTLTDQLLPADVAPPSSPHSRVTVPTPACDNETQRLVLDNICWREYMTIGEALRDRPGLRLTYDHGRLEIMTTSRRHEVFKKRSSRLLDILAEECNLNIDSAGNMTFQREDLER